MIFIGLDDTDSPVSRGTNQLAKTLVRTILGHLACLRIVRHQLLFDERIPYTSQNGSASIWLESDWEADVDQLFTLVSAAMRADYIPGSDPGLCIVERVPPEVTAFGRRCQQAIVTREEAYELAASFSIRLEGLGGTNGGVIGALAAVGLAATGDDGRVVQIDGEDDVTGLQPIAGLRQRCVSVVEQRTNEELLDGLVNVGKKLRPVLRRGRLVLYVERAAEHAADCWNAVKCT